MATQYAPPEDEVLTKSDGRSIFLKTVDADRWQSFVSGFYFSMLFHRTCSGWAFHIFSPFYY